MSSERDAYGDDDAFLAEQERRDALRLEPEHRRRLIRAVIESDAAGRGIATSDIDRQVDEAVSWPATDDHVVEMVERVIRDLTAGLVDVKRPLLEQYLRAEEAAAGRDDMRHARTRSNVARGEATRAAVIKAWKVDKKSIAATARDLGISASRVAKIRTEENKKARS